MKKYMVERMSIEEFRRGDYSVKKSKYGNKKTEYNGRIYDSRKEADYAKFLDSCYKASKPSDRVVLVEPQREYRIDIKGSYICSYFADFYVEYADGHTEVIDCKGFLTQIYRLKKKMMLACHGIKIIEI